MYIIAYLKHYVNFRATVEAQTQLSMAVEKERSSTEKMMTLQSRVTALEKQTTSLRQDKSRLTASLELEKAKVETFEESQQRYLMSSFTNVAYIHPLISCIAEIRQRWRQFELLYSSQWKSLGKKR